MAYENDTDDAADERESSYSRRSSPRFGPFLTIAVAILMLFGAASRLGKNPEDTSWLGLDEIARKNLESDRRRREDERNTILILGPVSRTDQRETGGPRLPLEELTAPPGRNLSGWPGESGDLAPPDDLRPPSGLSLPFIENGDDVPFFEGEAPYNGRPLFDPAPEAQPQPQRQSGSTYVVAEGDNLMKIAKKTNKRWQDIQKANPDTREGLRVGMRLVIP